MKTLGFSFFISTTFCFREFTGQFQAKLLQQCLLMFDISEALADVHAQKKSEETSSSSGDRFHYIASQKVGNP